MQSHRMADSLSSVSYAFRFISVDLVFLPRVVLE